MTDTRLEALAPSAASPGSRTRCGRPVRRAAALARGPGALRRGGARVARGRRPRRRTPRSSRRSTPPTTAGSRRSARSTPTASRGRRSTRCARPRRLGRPARVPLRLRRPDAAQLDAVETLVRHTDAEVCVALTYEPGRAALAGTATTVELLKPLAARARAARRPLRALRAERPRRAAPPRARRCSSRAPARRAAQRRGPAARGGRRARRGRARRRRGARAAARRHGAGGHRGAGPRRRRRADLFAQVLESYGDPGRPRAPHPAGRTRLGAGVLAFARAALPGRHARRRRDVAAHAGQARRRPPTCRRARGPASAAPRRRPPARRAARWRGSAGDARRARRAGGRGRARAPSRSSTRCSPRPRRSGPRRTAAPAAVLGPEAAADARAAPASCARAAEELRAPRGGRSRRSPATPQRVLEALARCRCASRRSPRRAGVLLADPLAIRARRFRAVFVCGLQEGELPAPPDARAVPRRRRAAALARAAGSCCRATRTCSPRERSLFYAVRLAPGGGAVPVLPHVRRGGRPAAALAVPRRRPRAVHRRAVGAARPAAAGRGHVAAGARRRRRTSCGARRPRAEERPDPPPLGAPADRGRARAARRARPRVRARAGDVRRLPGKWLIESSCARGAVEPDPEAMRRGSLAHAVLERTLRGLRERTGSARLTPATAAGGAGGARRRDRPSCRARRGTARAPGRRCARWRSTSSATPPRGRDAAPGYEPARLEWSFGGEGDATARCCSTASRLTGRVDRIDLDGRPRDRARLQGPHGLPAARAGREDGRIQAALYALAVRELLGARAGRRALPADRPPPTSARAASSATTSRAATSTATSATARARRRAGGGARDRRPGRRRPARRPHPACPDRCADTAAAPTRGSAAPATAPRRRRDALAAEAGRRRRRPASPPSSARRSRPRRGSSLLAANAGSGKTAVMVERFAEAVREDGVAGRRDPRADLHREGRGRARERLRRRLTELGEDEHARAVDGAVDRHHPRLLRPPAALPAARRRAWTRASRCSRSPPPSGSPSAAYERALEAWARAAARAAIDLAASYGPACASWSWAPTRRCAPAAQPPPR